MGAEDNLADRELLEMTAAGDGVAFAALMARHEEKVFACALRMLSNRADALDATQETFISAFRQASRFRGDAAVGTWIYRIAINACNDLLRKRKRWTTQDEQDNLVDGSTASLEDRVASELAVRVALARISEEYREAVVMHDIGGVPYEEIASVTGVPVGTVKSRISRGRKALARLLEQRSSPQTSKGTR